MNVSARFCVSPENPRLSHRNVRVSHPPPPTPLHAAWLPQQKVIIPEDRRVSFTPFVLLELGSSPSQPLPDVVTRGSAGKAGYPRDVRGQRWPVLLARGLAAIISTRHGRAIALCCVWLVGAEVGALSCFRAVRNSELVPCAVLCLAGARIRESENSPFRLLTSSRIELIKGRPQSLLHDLGHYLSA